MNDDGQRGPGRYALRRWMYRGGRPNRTARFFNRLAAKQYSSGVLTLGGRCVTLEVRGRISGKPIRLPLVVADVDAGRYLVSMLGRNATWVRNVQASGGRAVLLHKARTPVLLVEVPVEQRAPVLRRYLRLAPGARAHFPIGPTAGLEEFERIADHYPVYRITPDPDPDPDLGSL